MNLRPREQQFVDGVLRGEPDAVAAQKAGFKAKSGAAIRRRPEIVTAIEAGRAALSATTEWTGEKIIGRLAELAEGAALLNNPAASIRALEIIAKMIGALTEKLVIETPSIVEALALARARSGRWPLEAVDVPATQAPSMPQARLTTRAEAVKSGDIFKD